MRGALQEALALSESRAGGLLPRASRFTWNAGPRHGRAKARVECAQSVASRTVTQFDRSSGSEWRRCLLPPGAIAGPRGRGSGVSAHHARRPQTARAPAGCRRASDRVAAWRTDRPPSRRLRLDAGHRPAWAPGLLLALPATPAALPLHTSHRSGAPRARGPRHAPALPTLPPDLVDRRGVPGTLASPCRTTASAERLLVPRGTSCPRAPDKGSAPPREQSGRHRVPRETWSAADGTPPSRV